MQKMMRAVMSGVIALGLFAGLSYALQQNDGTLDIGAINVQSSGVRQFTVGTQPGVDNSLRVMQASSTTNGVPPYTLTIATNGRVGVNGDTGRAQAAPVSGFDIGPGGGTYYALKITTFSSAFLGTVTPAQVGEVVYNTTAGWLCISTGTTVGAFARAVSTHTNNGTINIATCN